jgi:hypothetical protein
MVVCSRDTDYITFQCFKNKESLAKPGLILCKIAPYKPIRPKLNKSILIKLICAIEKYVTISFKYVRRIS